MVNEELCEGRVLDLHCHLHLAHSNSFAGSGQTERQSDKCLACLLELGGSHHLPLPAPLYL